MKKCDNCKSYKFINPDKGYCKKKKYHIYNDEAHSCFDYKKENRFAALIKTLIIIIIVCIAIFLMGACNPQRLNSSYQMQLIDDGYVKLDYKADWYEDIRAKKIQSDLGKDTLINRYEIKWKIFKGNSKLPFKVKLNKKTYIPIKYEDVNRTKKNIFGKEKMILNNNIRNNKIVYEIN